jgi:hypothetical protein
MSSLVELDEQCVLEREAPSARGDLDRSLYQSKRDVTAPRQRDFILWFVADTRTRRGVVIVLF